MTHSPETLGTDSAATLLLIRHTTTTTTILLLQLVQEHPGDLADLADLVDLLPLDLPLAHLLLILTIQVLSLAGDQLANFTN